MPPLSELWKLYLRCFAVDRCYRLIKQRLHWTLPKLFTSQECARWSDLMPLTEPYWIGNRLLRQGFVKASVAIIFQIGIVMHQSDALADSFKKVEIENQGV